MFDLETFVIIDIASASSTFALLSLAQIALVYEGKVQKVLITPEMTTGDLIVKYAAHWGIAPSSLCIHASNGRLLTPEERVRGLLAQGIDQLYLIDRLKALKECEAVDLQVGVDRLSTTAIRNADTIVLGRDRLRSVRMEYRWWWLARCHVLWIIY
jgi:hypothetical protein